MKNIILTANGTQKADLVLKNASIVNVFTESIEVGDVAITDGKIVGIGRYEGKIEKPDASCALVLLMDIST